MAKTEGHSIKLPISILSGTGLLVDADSITLVRFHDPEDAEFIVKAVNNHERLLEACKKALELAKYNSNRHEVFESRQCLIEAIKAVEGE